MTDKKNEFNIILNSPVKKIKKKVTYHIMKIIFTS